MVDNSTRLLTTEKCSACKGMGKVDREECTRCDDGSGRKSISVKELSDYFSDKVKIYIR